MPRCTTFNCYRKITQLFYKDYSIVIERLFNCYRKIIVMQVKELLKSISNDDIDISLYFSSDAAISFTLSDWRKGLILEIDDREVEIIEIRTNEIFLAEVDS